jgi:hypothetical protein
MGNCCLNISVIGFIERGIVYEANCPITGEYPSFSFQLEESEISLIFNEELSIWQMIDGDILLSQSTYEGDNECPSGLQFTFSGGDKSPDFTFTVYQFPCDLTPTPPIIEYAPECLQEACRNKNLLNKQKRALAEDIAGISKKEIFGFKCGDAWENIFMRNLIIHALSCMPTGVLSVEKEKCLIGKLTDKCNC